MKRQILFRRCSTMLALSIVLGLTISLVAITGCSDTQKSAANETLNQLQAVRAATTQATADAQRAVDDAKNQIATLPANDPTRKQAEATLAKATDVVNQISDKTAKLDRAIELANQLAKNPTPDNPILDTVASSLGAYGTLGLILLRLGYKEWDSYRKSKALQQTIAGLSKSPLSPEQKTALASAQDVSTKALVTQIKGA